MSAITRWDSRFDSSGPGERSSHDELLYACPQAEPSVRRADAAAQRRYSSTVVWRIPALTSPQVSDVGGRAVTGPATVGKLQ